MILNTIHNKAQTSLSLLIIPKYQVQHLDVKKVNFAVKPYVKSEIWENELCAIGPSDGSK